MQPDTPWQSRTRNENDDGESNARITIRSLLQAKRDRQQSDEKDRNRVRDQICSKIIRLERSNGCPTAVATIRSTESVNVASRVDCITTKVAIAAQYASGICTSRAITTDAVAATAVRNRVCHRRKILLVPSP